MTSLILSTATRILLPLFIIFSIFLLFRGHNLPGGGFVGGLVAASAFALYAIAYNSLRARAVLQIEPRKLIIAGLFFAGASGLIALLTGQSYLTGKWLIIYPPYIGELHIGTPLLFDIGVYLVVIGASLMILFHLMEEE